MIAKSRRERQQLGQYFTPPALAGAIWELVALFRSHGRSRVPRAMGPILEPSIGTGVFLTEGLARGLSADAMVGVDLDPGLTGTWQELCRQHPGLTLIHGDALRPHPALTSRFELVIGNPPFGSEGLYALHEPASPEGRELAAALSTFTICHKVGQHKTARQLATFPIECLFIERSVQLAAPGGWIALILPEGLLSNGRLQHVRDWTLARCAVRAVVTLPASSFRTERTSARTAVLLLEKGGTAPEAFLATAHRPADLARVLDDAERFLTGQQTATVAASAALAGERWDPAYWTPELAAPLLALQAHHQTVPLGTYITHLTYGPIVTGRHPESAPGDVWLLNQGELGYTGLELDGASRVAADGVFDPPRSRPRRGDLLFARSGVGSLAKGRMAILDEDLRANVGCFVDVIRFAGLDPHFAWLFLASRFGQGQIRRLINGVATPNLSFPEIRGLRIPVLEAARQAELGGLYREHVQPLHRAYQAVDPAERAQREAARQEAAAAMRQAIERLEEWLV